MGLREKKQSRDSPPPAAAPRRLHPRFWAVLASQDAAPGLFWGCPRRSQPQQPARGRGRGSQKQPRIVSPLAFPRHRAAGSAAPRGTATTPRLTLHWRDSPLPAPLPCPLSFAHFGDPSPEITHPTQTVCRDPCGCLSLTSPSQRPPPGREETAPALRPN